MRHRAIAALAVLGMVIGPPCAGVAVAEGERPITVIELHIVPEEPEVEEVMVVGGSVIFTDNSEGVANAEVTVSGEAIDLTLVMTDPQGRFEARVQAPPFGDMPFEMLVSVHEPDSGETCEVVLTYLVSEPWVSPPPPPEPDPLPYVVAAAVISATVVALALWYVYRQERHRVDD